MIDNKDLQHINTFVGGMDLDTGDQYLSESCYREAYNLRLTTATNGNSGTLHNIEGVKYYQNITTNLPALPEGEMYTNIRVVHTDSIRKYGIIMVKADVDLVTSYYIFRFINKDDLTGAETGTPQLIFGPCATILGDNISSVTRYEDDDNIKFYYADAMSPIRSLNISPAIDSTRPMTDDGSFSIYPTALLSQPEFISLGSGNLVAGAYQYGYQLFTKNGAETEISPLTNLIHPTESSITPDVDTSVKGSLKGSNTGKSIQIRIAINDPKYDRIRIVSVFYEDTTSVPLIQVLGDLDITHNADGSVSDIYYQDINNQGISTMTPEEFNLITSIHFAPKVLESKNNILFASDIQYQDNTFDVDFDARSYSYIPDSSGNLVAVLKSNDGTSEIIATREDILDGTVVIPTEHDCINPYSQIAKAHNSFTTVYNTNVATENMKCCYSKTGSQVLWGGDGVNVNWRFRVTDLDDVTDGALYVDSSIGHYGYNGNVPAAKARKFQGVWTSNITQAGTLTNTEFLKLTDVEKKATCNYSNPVIASKLRSLQRDEVYRYGIILYNTHNQASPVKWIADIRTPSSDTLGFEAFMANRTAVFTESKSELTRSALTTRPLGIEFTVNNLPSDITSYEIVRCRRTDSDRATITQGIIGNVSKPEVQPSGNATFPFQQMVTSYANLQNSNNILYNDTEDIDLRFENDFNRRMSHRDVNFASPEICYNHATMKDSLPSTGLVLSAVKYLYSNESSIPIAQRGDTILDGSRSKLKKVIGKDRQGALDIYGYYPYYYTTYQYNIRRMLFEQSNSVNLSNGNTDSSSGWTGGTSAGNETVINNIIFPTETSWKDYRAKLDFIDGAGATTYTDWVINKFNLKDNAYTVEGSYVQGPHGRSILIQTTDGIVTGTGPAGGSLSPITSTGQRIVSTSGTIGGSTTVSSLGSRQYYKESVTGTLLCNLRKIVVPYGGYNYSARQYNTYISIGGFNVNGATNRTTVFGGDVFINRFKYVNLHYFAGLSAEGVEETPMTTNVQYYVPVESVINLAYTSGPQINTYTQIEPANVNGKYIQDTPLYVYNSIYSVEPYARLFTPESLYDEYNKHVDVRTHYSLGKSNDEMVDQWTKFQPLNYLDVDTRHGSVNGLRTFNNELIFWQSNAVGKFSVEERSLINDSSNLPLILGTGGVLNRYDYISTTNGLHDGHNDSDCQSDIALYWYDYDKHELCAYSNGEVVCISKVRNVHTYLNNLSLNMAQQAPKPINTYDKQYNEVISTLSNNESLVFNESMNMFTSFYTLVPDYNLYFNNDVYLVTGEHVYKYNDNVVNNGFDSLALPIELNYIVNKDYLHTKVYDNIEFTGIFDKDNMTINYEADNIDSKPLSGSTLTDREYNYRGAVPRANTSETFANRLRGRVLHCRLNYNLGSSENNYIVTNEAGENITTIVPSEYMVTNNNERKSSSADLGTGTRFELPYMRTTFRVSRS